MRKFGFFLLGMLLFSAQLLAQNRTITGKIFDEKGSPIANASVVIKGTIVGTVTDREGSFSLSVPENTSVLVVTSVGFASQDVTIGSSNTISVNLKGSDTSLEEVVVVGYSTSTKEA